MLHKADVGNHASHETSVVGALLSSKDERAQKMGIGLLLTILKTQDSAEYISKLDKFVPLLCKIAVDGANQRSEEDGKTVSASALQCLLEHLRLCSRISYIARHMGSITDAALTIIDREGDSAIAAYESCNDLPNGHVNVLALGKLSMGTRIGASHPCQAAVLIFKEIGAATQDSLESRNVTEYWIQFMEKVPSRWSGGSALEVGLGVLRDSCKVDHQKYALSCSLIRHLASLGKEGIGYQDGALVKVILSQAFLLRAADVTSLLLLTIRAIGSLLHKESIDDPISQIVYDAIKRIALRTNSRTQIATVIEAALSHTSSGQDVVGIVWLCEAASSVYLEIPLQRSEDCNVTETMVSAIRDICSSISDGADFKKFVILNSLTILRHTFEATAPESHTSVRCARVLVAYLWSMLSSPCATPDIFVVIQAVFRSFTETDITFNEDLDISVSFVASLNGELSAYSMEESGEFCNRQHVPVCQVTAAAAIADSMWECLKNSMKHIDPQIFDSFKPVLQGEEDAHLLYVNSIGMAVSKNDSSSAVSFPEQPDTYNVKGLFSCKHRNPTDIFEKFAGSTRRSGLLNHINVASMQGSQDSTLSPDHIVAVVESIQSLDKELEVSFPDSPQSPHMVQGKDPVEETVSFASGAEALASLSRHLVIE